MHDSQRSVKRSGLLSRDRRVNRYRVVTPLHPRMFAFTSAPIDLDGRWEVIAPADSNTLSLLPIHLISPFPSPFPTNRFSPSKRRPLGPPLLM